MSRPVNHDVIIIGGGVNGTGIARDCALRGLKPLLIERNDLAKGASGANTGMIHGGIRYLRFDVATTKRSCTDSGYIQQIAPHLLFRIPFLFPVLDDDAWGALLLEGAEIFFESYDAYQPLKHGKSHTRLTAKEARSLEPGLSANIIGAVTMDEWGIDPFRLTVANALDAQSHGASIRTYCTVDSFIREEDQIRGVVFTDRLTGKTETHSAPLVINATGAWGPHVAEMAGVHYKLRPGKGVHIVYSHRICNYGLVMIAVDGRQMFIMPHENGAIAGTTDDDYYGDLDNPRATEDEVKYIMQAARRVFPKIDDYRMSRTYVGVRPTLHEWAKDEDHLSREHEFFDHAAQGAPGLISVAGGKLAAYRQLSEEVTDIIAERLGNKTPCRTHTDPLPGAEKTFDVADFAQSFNAPRLSVARMAYRHGANAEKILERTVDSPRKAANVCLCEPVTWAEIEHACDNELVRRLNDVRRRTRMSMGACGGTRCLARCSQVLAERTDLSAPEQLLELRDAMCGRFIGRRPVLEGKNLATEELNQAMHFLTGNLRPYFRAAELSSGRYAVASKGAPDPERTVTDPSASPEPISPRATAAAPAGERRGVNSLIPEPR